MDYSKYLVLYSGGVDSTFFIENEKTARYLLFFKGRNKKQAKVAITNANILKKYINVVSIPDDTHCDGSIYVNEIHALHDTQNLLRASIIAVSHGMKGIVACFNKDDMRIDFDSVIKIVKKAEPKFELLLPLIDMSAKEIREKHKKSKLKTVSCMNGYNCGYCIKCTHKY